MTGTWYPPSLGTGGVLIEAQLFTNPPFAMSESPRRFVSIMRTITPAGNYILDAIDEDGRAWWRVPGGENGLNDWAETKPLPSREAQP